ncbi:unnamed protein product [Closterium sp. NIES-53]
MFYDPVTHQFFSSQDVIFDESVSYHRSRPHRDPVVSGGAGGAVVEGEGTRAAGARGASFGGVRLETTPEEDTTVSTHPLASRLFRSSLRVHLRGRSLRSLEVFLQEALESLGVLSVEVLVLGVVGPETRAL